MDSSMKRLQQDDQVSRRKRKMTFLIIFFILLFAIIIGSIISVIVVIELGAESEESAANPEGQIRAVCDLTPFPTSCFHPIYELLRASMTTDDDDDDSAGEKKPMIKATPSRIFALSLRAASDELDRVISSNQMAISKLKVPKDSRLLPALKSCDVLFRVSSRLLKISMAKMGTEPNDKTFKNAKIRNDLKEWIASARKNMSECLIGLNDDAEELNMIKIKVENASEYVENSSEMLGKMDKILGLFNQQIIIGGIRDNYKFLLHSLGSDYFGIFFYCLQFLFLVALICTVLLYWRSQ